MASARTARLWLLALGVLLAAAALRAGSVAALSVSPLACVALGLASRVASETSQRLALAVGALGSAAGLALALAGAGTLGLLATLAAAGALRAALALRLAHSAPPGRARRVSPRLHTAVALDEAALGLLGLHARRPGAPGAAELAHALRSCAEANRARGFVEHPHDAHLRPPPLDKARLLPGPGLGAEPGERLLAASEFTASDARLRDAWQDLAENRTSHAWLWRHRDGPRPTLICVHAFGGGRVGVEARRLALAELHGGLGLDVVLYALPLHGPRAAGDAARRLLDGDPGFAAALLGQAVWDLRRLAGWLRGAGAPTLGVLGVGLGGAAAAILAGLDSRLACAALVRPVVGFAELFERARPEALRAVLLAAGVDAELAADAFAPIEPLRHTPRLPRGGRLIAGAAADRIVPAELQDALYERWERPARHEQPGGRLAPGGSEALRARLAQHLRATLLGDELRTPSLTRFRI